MKRFNVVTKKVYQQNGQEKAQWNTVGTLVCFPASQDKPESFILELSMFPETKFFVFEQGQKDTKRAPKEAPAEPDVEEEIIDDVI